MARLSQNILRCAGSIALLTAASIAVKAQATSPQSQRRPPLRQTATTNLTIDSSEAMFTTMCALFAAGFESDVSAANWHPLRAQLRERMQHQQGPAVEALREFYKRHQIVEAGSMLSEYIWFGLVSGPGPDFRLTMRRDELPPEVIALEGFSEILSAYYKEQKIGPLWRELQPIYNQEIDRLHEPISQIVFVATNYLREMMNPSNPRTFTVIVEPLVGRITNVRNFGDHYAIVLSGSQDVPINTVRHAYLHFLLDPLPLAYSHVVAVKRPLFETAARAPRLEPELKEDFSSYFAECTVRAVELRLKRGSPSEREAALAADDADGYVLVRPLYTALQNYEKSEPPMKLYFPDLVRSIDNTTEEKRVEKISFAAAEAAPKSDETAKEAIARRSAQLQPKTIPNDADAIAALTEGERQIAAKNARAAEASFQRVLAKYPDQPRALYGIGLVALIDHDGPRAKEVFGRLTAGQHAASDDPMVLAWSHIYLARIYDDEGQTEQAKSEYQQALAVQGGPEQARRAAQKGLESFDGQRPSERP